VNYPNSLIRYLLGALLAFAALNAFGGGYYAISGAEGVPLEWLDGSPFKDYFIPGIILFVVVGGAFLIASIAVVAKLKFARLATFNAVAIVSVWLLVQVLVIGYVSWMQPTTAAVAMLILFLGMILFKQESKPVANLQK
jgi:hypothetical protein